MIIVGATLAVALNKRIIVKIKRAGFKPAPTKSLIFGISTSSMTAKEK
jgi:hypothetical protein